jgi:predicted tellurium resistance membrane protein TerC
MSLDNVLAVAGASKGSLLLLIFGLALSIPLVVFTSNLLSRLMDRYVGLVYLGAAILGKVSGEMIMSDPLIADRFQPPAWAVHAAEVALAVGVILIALAWQRFTRKGAPAAGPS